MKIILQFGPEAGTWLDHSSFDFYAINVTVPGFSPRYPDAHCTATGEVCLLTTGEAGTVLIYLTLMVAMLYANNF